VHAPGFIAVSRRFHSLAREVHGHCSTAGLELFISFMQHLGNATDRLIQAMD